MMQLAVALAGINSVILIVLLYIYGRMMLRTKALYSAGLFVFALLLLLQSAITGIGYIMLSPYFADEALPLMSIVGGLELAGLVVLVRITL
jgi:hypothetical protein